MNIEQFETLLKEVEDAYEQSGLKDKNLYYSLVGTHIKPNQPLIVGLNWGGGAQYDNHHYQPQTNEDYQKYIKEDRHFFSEGIDAGSLLNIRPYIEKYTDIDLENAHIGWINFCFFRTPDDSTLSEEAMELSKPIFLKLIKLIKPSMIIGLSSKLRDYFIEEEMLSGLEKYQAKNENSVNEFNGYRATLNDICPVYILPHPSPRSRVGSIAKDYAWKFCFGNNDK